MSGLGSFHEHKMVSFCDTLLLFWIHSHALQFFLFRFRLQNYTLEVQSFCAVVLLFVSQSFLLILFYRFPHPFHICFGSRLLLLFVSSQQTFSRLGIVQALRDLPSTLGLSKTVFPLSVLFCTQQPFGSGEYVDGFVVFFNRLLSAEGNQRKVTAVELFCASQQGVDLALARPFGSDVVTDLY